MASDHRLAVALAAALSLLSTTSLAAPTAAEKETARSLMKSARDKRKAGDLRGALDEFTKAHALMNVTTTGLEVGKTQLELGLLVEARSTLLDVARIPAAPGEAAPLSKARDEAKKLADDILPRIPSARLTLQGATDPAVITLTIDDTPLVKETLGTPLKLNPGSHAVTARILVTMGPQAAPNPGALARATGDQRRVSFDLREGETKDVTLDVTGLVRPAAPPPAPGVSLLVPIGFSIAGAGAIAGGVTGGLAIAKYRAASPKCVDQRCPPETHADIDAGKRLGTGSTIAFVLAGAGAAVGVVGLFLPRKATGSAAVTPWIGLGAVGIRGEL